MNRINQDTSAGLPYPCFRVPLRNLPYRALGSLTPDLGPGQAFKPDFLPGLIGRRHKLPDRLEDGQDLLIMFLNPAFKLPQLDGKLLVRWRQDVSSFISRPPGSAKATSVALYRCIRLLGLSGIVRSNTLISIESKR